MVVKLWGVGNSLRKPVIGLLGGVASGKSTVAAEFGRLGCAVIDADKISHKKLDEEDVRAKIVSVFGASILGPKGSIDRKKLGDIVFGDGERLSALTSIIHPLVLVCAERLIERYIGEDWVKAVVLDMPLLVEVGWDKRCDKLIFIDCKWELRLDRAKKKGIFDESQLRNRENLQIPLDRKVALSDNTIENNSGLSELARQVADIFSHIVG
ncbi:MAG: dephospho-CoA kinase [Planctomycetota bacterium]